MKNWVFIVLAIVSLLAIAVPMIIVLLGKRKEWQIARVWASPNPATKYRELRFDRDRGEFLIEADVFFTEKNSCPIHFISRDGKQIKADIYFRYTVLEYEFKDSKTMKYIESQSRKILTEELENLTIALDSGDIGGHSFQHLRAIRPIFNQRMIEFVKDVDHLFLIGKMNIIEEAVPGPIKKLQFN